MNISRFASVAVLIMALGFARAGSAEFGGAKIPFVDGPWWQVAGNPDLGKYTTAKQQPVDFAVWQAADGTWQLWSCVRHTSCEGKTRLFHGWEADKITDKDWRPRGIMMEADPKLGETAGGLQAPHVVKQDDTYYMLYGDWEHICLATSKDGKKFERYVTPAGKTSLFTEGAGTNTRDIVALKIGDLWHGYYTAYPNRQGAVYCRTSPDFKKWSESTCVAFGGRAGVNPFAAECPHVITHDGRHYLFRTQKYGQQARSCVYSSTDPLNFGINQDRRYFLTEMPVAAMEIAEVKGQHYIAALLPSLKGIQIAKLGWTDKPAVGKPIFDLSNDAERARWKVVRGALPHVFTQSQRDRFDPPASHFIATAEGAATSGPSDKQTCVIQSPSFKIEKPWLFAYLSGGTDQEKLHVALVDADTKQELVRVTPLEQANTLVETLLNVSPYVGREVLVQVTDNSEAPWGHINFGGLHAPK
jgi:hypothetical protein